MSVHFSTQSNEWSTPGDFFNRLDEEFHFTIDVAATTENAKCDRFYSLRDNGLAQDWTGETVWCNPPYKRQAFRWIEKAKYEKAVSVLLIPARTDTRMWGLFWDYENHKPIEGCEVRFISGRLKFGGGADKRSISECGNNISKLKDAPFPAAIVIFRNDK